MNPHDRPVEGVGDLSAYFDAAETPREAWAVGTEHEKVGVYADTGDRVPYEGPYGIGALLEKVHAAVEESCGAEPTGCRVRAFSAARCGTARGARTPQTSCRRT